MSYLERFRVRPGTRVRLADMDPSFKGRHESQEAAAGEIEGRLLQQMRLVGAERGPEKPDMRSDASRALRKRRPRVGTLAAVLAVVVAVAAAGWWVTRPAAAPTYLTAALSRGMSRVPSPRRVR